MDLNEIQSLVDFGLCIVLWLVQLVIYPSFLRVAESELVAWHRTYTFRVSFVIMPLMLSQLGLAFVAVIRASAEWWDALVLALVLFCWALTFFIAVPLHNKMEKGDLSKATRLRLIHANWPRTFLWTAIFLIGLF